MKNEHNSRLSHIDGLKGIAIIYVLIFHAYMKNFSVGYLGVDVFFVISGYFLFKGRYFKQNTISELKGFLAKKVGRLVAPLTAMVLVTVIAGLFLTLPRELETTLYTGLYTLLGCSSQYLSISSHQYFSPETAYNPFMHTWYISVLIEIFLLFAIGTIILKKLPSHKQLYILSIIFIVSLILSTRGIITDHLDIFGKNFSLPFDYYSTTTRVWEVLAGGSLVFIKNCADKVDYRVKRYISIIALSLLIFIPIICVERGRNLRPLIIVLSTMVCIVWGNKSLSGAVLSWKPLRKLGEISFSLYLVHMPILAFYRAAPRGNIYTDILVAVTILILGTAFYLLVEQKKLKIKTIAIGWAATLCCIGTFLAITPQSLFLWKSLYAHFTPYENWTKCEDESYFKGLDTTVLEPYDGTAWMSRTRDTATANRKLPIGREVLLTIGKQEEANYLLIGDSFASMLYYGLNDWGKKQGPSGLYLQTYMVPFYGWQLKGKNCSERCRALLTWLKQHPEIKSVIISQHWKLRTKGAASFTQESGYLLSVEEGLELFLQKLKEIGCRVGVIAQLPALYAAQSHSERMQMTAFDAQTCSRQDYEAWSKNVNEMLECMVAKGLCSVIHLEDAYFSDGQMHASENGEYLMFDGGHLSPYGSGKVIQANSEKLTQWIDNK